MLVLTRKIHQSIMIGEDIEVVVLEVRGEQVRIGIRAPKGVAVHRKEVFDQIKMVNLESAEVRPEDLPA
jgi:carbon storage regulator